MFRRRRGFRRSRRPTRWLVADNFGQTDTITAVGSSHSIPLVWNQPNPVAATSGNVIGLGSMTVMRIRGQIIWGFDFSASIASIGNRYIIHFGILCQTQGSTTSGWPTLTQPGDAMYPWMWLHRDSFTQGFQQVNLLPDASIVPMPGGTVEVDVKVKRKLRPDEQLALIWYWSQPGGTDVLTTAAINPYLRVLIAKGD